MPEACLSLNIIRPSNITGLERLPVAVWITGSHLRSAPGQLGLAYVFDAEGGLSTAAFCARPALRVSSSRAPALDHSFIEVSSTIVSTFLAFSRAQTNLPHMTAPPWPPEPKLDPRVSRGEYLLFGGEREFTSFGQSAGGLSVGKQLIVYGGRDHGLLRAAIMQSGGTAEKWPYNIKDLEAHTKELCESDYSDGCTGSASTLVCLHALPTESLSAALNISNAPLFVRHFVPVPIMYTITTDEVWLSASSDSVDTDTDFQNFIAACGLDEVTISELEAL